MQKANFDIRQILQIVRRRKWFLILPIIVAAGVAYFRVKTTIPVYQSTASILLGQNTFITESMSRVLPGVEQQNRQRVWNRRHTIIKQLYSKQLLSKVIDRIGLEPSEKLVQRATDLQVEYPNMALADIIRTLQINSLSKKIIVDIPRRGEYFEVGAKSTDPEKAYLIAKTLADIFIEEDLLQELSGVRETLQFSSEQLKLYKRKLDEAEKKLRDFKRQSTNQSSDKLPVNSENLSQVSALIASISANMSEKLDELNAIETELGSLTSEIRLLKTSKAATLKAELIEKISQRAELMITFPWNSREVLKLNQDIAGLIDQLVDEIRQNSARGLEGRFGQRDIDLAVRREAVLNEIDLLRKQKSTLNRLVELYKSQQSDMPAYELTLQKLQAEVQKNREIYLTFREQVQSMQIREAMQRSESQILYKILDPAQIPVIPINADLKQVILITLLFGIGVGVGSIYLLEYFDNSFKSVEDLESHLGLVVLGTVPKIDFAEQRSNGRRWAVPLFAISLVVAVVVAIVLLRQ